jgi:hypothetical protein
MARLQFAGRCLAFLRCNSIDAVETIGWVDSIDGLREFETRSFPNSLVAYPSDFTFYVAHPDRSIHS